jgi:hypothetical protein
MIRPPHRLIEHAAAHCGGPAEDSYLVVGDTSTIFLGTFEEYFGYWWLAAELP